MPYCYTFKNFTDGAWAICDLSTHRLLQIFAYPGSQTNVTLSLESISTFPFQAGTRYVIIPKWAQHSSDSVMPCLRSISAKFWGTLVQPRKIQTRYFGERCMCFRLLPIVWYSGQAGWSPQQLFKWVLPNTYITATIIAPPVSGWCTAQHKAPVVV